MGCFRSCVKCLSLVPWASLIALVACWAGVALFCGAGHEALTTFDILLENALQYSIYGIASFMFVITILLLTDGILATRAVKKELEYTYRSKKCGICCGIFFLLESKDDTGGDDGITYTVFSFMLSASWLLISVFTGFAVYFFIVSNSQCDLAHGGEQNVCINFVQAGLMYPQNGQPEDYGELCGTKLYENFCAPTQYYLTYQMVLITFAGACITVLSMKQFLMALSANYAYVKMARKLVDYQDTKFREQMELNQIIETARSNERLTYSY